MKKIASLFLSGLFFAALSSAAQAQPLDRHERYRDGGPRPPRRGAEVPPPQHAVYGQPYFFANLGLFEPNDSANGLEGYDTGGNFNIGIGSRVSPVLAVEGSLGGFSAERGPDEVTVVPLTFGVRLVIPHPFIEPYIGAGAGLYFADLKEPRSNPVLSIDDSDTVFGGYGSIGVDAWLNPRTALNFEGRYHWAEPTFTAAAGNTFDVKVGGWTINLGVRLSF
ncbi:MAG: porin family protein [Deltaproteobacteria bacterium]|nr:porin family protein [Deltaproteobacteria bacterium]